MKTLKCVTSNRQITIYWRMAVSSDHFSEEMGHVDVIKLVLFNHKLCDDIIYPTTQLSNPKNSSNLMTPFSTRPRYRRVSIAMLTTSLLSKIMVQASIIERYKFERMKWMVEEKIKHRQSPYFVADKKLLLVNLQCKLSLGNYMDLGFDFELNCNQIRF